MLNHTSGIQDHAFLYHEHKRVAIDGNVYGEYLFESDKLPHSVFMPTNEDVIKILQEFLQSRFKPGAKWERSNSGYVLLVQLIENITGMHFRDYSKKNIFLPLAMKQPGVYDESRPKPENKVSSYVAKNGEFADGDYSPLNLIYRDGGIYFTMNDLVKWQKAWFSPSLLSEASLNTIRTPGLLIDGSLPKNVVKGKAYGMGVLMRLTGYLYTSTVEAG